MCGRYTITVTIEELMLRYLLDMGMDMPISQFRVPRYNVAPMQPILAVVHDGQTNRIGEIRWGLVPGWAKDDKTAGKMINARAETLLEKPSFKHLIHRKRCIIPADGFYEWKQTDDGKQPMRIVMKDRGIFSMAGLYDLWLAPDGRKLATCTIITTAPNRLMEDIHHRMPAILRPEDEPYWLDRSRQDAGRLMELLRPYPADEMTAYPVPHAVGNVRNDSKELIADMRDGGV